MQQIYFIKSQYGYLEEINEKLKKGAKVINIATTHTNDRDPDEQNGAYIVLEE